MNINRNSLCPCGSGLKHKKCCWGKQVKDEYETVFTLDQVLNHVHTILNLTHQAGGCDRPIRVKKVELMNEDSLSVSFYAYSSKSQDVKLEISIITSVLNGIFRDSSEIGMDFKNYGIRAYDAKNTEIMSAISSKASAEMIGKGNSTDWLRTTIFQDNTPDHRLTIAKRMISEIENGLRLAIVNIQSNKHGQDWWNCILNNSTGNKVKNTYENQFGESISDGNILIKYMYLLDLKKVITTCWPDFKHLFLSKLDFETSLDKMNIIRREEAHNRLITEDHLVELDKVYFIIMRVIVEEYPETAQEYLVQNWHNKIQKIFRNGYKPLFSEGEMQDEENPKMKIAKIALAQLKIIGYLKDLESKLNSLTVPVQKRDVHKDVTDTISHYRILHEALVDSMKSGDLSEIEYKSKKIDDYQSNMDSLVERFLLSA